MTSDAAARPVRNVCTCRSWPSAARSGSPNGSAQRSWVGGVAFRVSSHSRAPVTSPVASPPGDASGEASASGPVAVGVPTVGDAEPPSPAVGVGVGVSAGSSSPVARAAASD